MGKVTDLLHLVGEGGPVPIPDKIVDMIWKWFEPNAIEMKQLDRKGKRVKSRSKEFTLKAKDFPFNQDVFRVGKYKDKPTLVLKVDILSPATARRSSFIGRMSPSGYMELFPDSGKNTLIHELTHLIQFSFGFGYRNKEVQKNPEKGNTSTQRGRRHANDSLEYKTRLRDEIEAFLSHPVLTTAPDVDTAIKLWFGLPTPYSRDKRGFSGTYQDMDKKTKAQREIAYSFIKDFSIAAHKRAKITPMDSVVGIKVNLNKITPRYVTAYNSVTANLVGTKFYRDMVLFKKRDALTLINDYLLQGVQNKKTLSVELVPVRRPSRTQPLLTIPDFIKRGDPQAKKKKEPEVKKEPKVKKEPPIIIDPDHAAFLKRALAK